jgi:23S rRNA (pseudouridine1915-N3)-methyltransferase
VRIVVIAVGRVKEASMRACIDEYVGRVRRYTPIDEVEIDPALATPKVAAAIAKAATSARLVALDVGGKEMESPAFAHALERGASTGKGIVAFAIGAADGLPPETIASAHERWSLSRLTFPHRLARLVLVEQLYRAMSILRNDPYAH